MARHMTRAIVSVPRVGRRRRSRLMRNEVTWGYLFIVPWALGFILFTAGPMVASMVISFMRYDIVQPMKWAGLANYSRLTQDFLIRKSLSNTAFYTFIGVPLHSMAALAAAMLLTRKVPGRNFFRTMFYIPSVVPMVANTILWMWLLNPDWGLANMALMALGLPPQLWLYSVRLAKPSYILMSLWSLGTQMVIYTAGIENIPESFYEAAQIDGAGRLQSFLHITIPMLSPIIFFNLIVAMIGSFQVFTVAFVAGIGGSGWGSAMSAGGPSHATLFYVLYLYGTAWVYFRMGYASAMAWLLFVIIIAFTGLQFWLSRRWVFYEA